MNTEITENNAEILSKLIPVLSDYLEVSNSDRASIKELIGKVEHSVEAMKECAVTMKLQLKEMETRSEIATHSFQAREAACNRRYEQYDARLAECLTKKELDRIKILEIKHDKIVPVVYKIVGAGGLVITLVTAVVVFLIKT